MSFFKNIKRVLVTGGAGFIGSHLVRALAAQGKQVIVFDDLSTGCRENVPLVEHVELVQGDVLNPDAIARAAVDIDLVIHLAAIVGMKRVYTYTDAGCAYRVSDEGAANVLAATGNPPILFMSSSAVYGLTRSNCASEVDPMLWEDAIRYDGGKLGYACGKQRLELRARDAMASGRSVMILRPFNVVGPGQVSTYGMVLPNFVRQARCGEPLLIHDDGAQMRSFGDVYTFVDCVMRLLELPAAWLPELNPINVGTIVSTSIRHLAEIVLRETSSLSSLQFVPYDRVYPGKQDVRLRKPDTQRLESLLGPVTWAGLDHIVRELVR